MKRMSGIERLLVSLAGGILVPFGYFLLILPLVELTGSLGFSMALHQVLFMPLFWPQYLYIFLFGLTGNQTINILFLVACNIILYGLITYAVLSALYRKRVQPELPPPPPQFQQQTPGH